MNQYMVSRYNWCIEENECLILYNGFTGAFVKIDDPSLYGVAKSLAKNDSIPEELFSCDRNILESLLKTGFIIPGTFDERDYLKLHTDQLKYQNNLSVTAVITYDCNFDCSYCYENNKRTSVHKSISKRVINNITKLANQIQPDIIYLTIYGGEPLLYKEKCYYLLKQINHVEMSKTYSNLITNGYFLDHETASSLAGLGVRSAQVTIDGKSETHDRHRKLKSGGSTHSRIIENAKVASQYMKIFVRVSLSDEVLSDFAYVRSEFENFPNVFVYPAAILDYSCTNSCSIPYFDRIERIIGSDEMPEIGIKVKHPGCIATIAYGIVVLPDGKLVKCWREVSDSGDTPDIPYGIDARSLPGLFRRWSDYNPYSSESKCYSCKMLPSCGGGCPYNHVNGEEINCKYSVSTYRQYIKRLYATKFTSNN